MDSYNDRISKFNDMINTTNEHVKAVAAAATKIKDSPDPIGTGISLTGALAGGVGGIAGAVGGIQHFKDFKTMYKGIQSSINNKLNGQTNTSDSGSSSNVEQSSGSTASDENVPQTTSSATESTPNIDGGIEDRINNLDNIENPSAEANDINKAINTKVTQTLGKDGKGILNNAANESGRSGDIDLANQFEGDLRTGIQKDFLTFKNNVANDSIQRFNSGKPQASGYDSNGNATGDLPTESNPTAAENTVSETPQNNVNQVAPENNVDLAPDVNEASTATNSSGDTVNIGESLDNDASGIIERGRQALSNLVGGQQVPGSQGQAVQGLRTMGDDVSQNVNAGSRVQQQVADQAEHETSALRNPNGTELQDMASNGDNGLENATTSLNPFQGGTNASNTADEISNIGSKVASGVTDATEGGDIASTVATTVASGVGDTIATGLEGAAAFSGPAAPILGLIGGLVGLGSTIAGLFHKKPPPQTIAPPPATNVSVGGNLKDQLSGMGAGIA